jgi:Flp pilus assembly CpaE family ATPase
VKPAVLIAGGGAAWEARVVAALEPGEHGVVIGRRCVVVVDLLAAAGAGLGKAALVAGSLRRLDADVVDRLVAASVAPVGVVARGDTEAEDRLRALGIDHLVPDDADPAVIASVLTEAVTRTGAAGGATVSQRVFADPATSMAIPPGEAPPIPAAHQARHGSIIAVWGPTGAPGRTTVAVSLAAELAHSGAASLLVDADVYGATAAAVLGLLDESPGLAAACRQAAATRLDEATLARLCWQLSPTLRVLTGLPLAARWSELRPPALSAVLGAARGLADFTVVDCGFCLETDEELSFDTVAPRRNGATLTVLDGADVVLAVGAADPIGMQRLIRALPDLREQVSAPIWVVLNKVRRGPVPGDPGRELSTALQRFAGCAPAALLPYDRAALDRALAVGRLLAEAAPSSPLRGAVRELAAALSGAPERPRRGRRAHRSRA